MMPLKNKPEVVDELVRSAGRSGNDHAGGVMDDRRSPSTQTGRGARHKHRIDHTEIRRRSLERWENEGGRCYEDDLTDLPART